MCEEIERGRDAISVAIPIFLCDVVAVLLCHLTGSLLVNIPRLYLRYTRDVRYIGDINACPFK